MLVATRTAAKAARRRSRWGTAKARTASVRRATSVGRSSSVSRPSSVGCSSVGRSAAHVVTPSTEGRWATHVPAHVPASHVPHVSAAHASHAAPETAAEAARPSKTVLANLDPTVVPHEAVKLMDRVGRIHR